MFFSAQLEEGGASVLFNNAHISQFTWDVRDDNSVVGIITDAATGKETRIQLGTFSGGEAELYRKFAKVFGDYRHLG